MPLLEFQTYNFRNLVSDRHSFSPRVNLIHGDNGSGKSSLLEAIHYLGVGRSFRTHKHEAVVTHGADSLSVFGKVAVFSKMPGAGPDSPTSAEDGDRGTITHHLGISRDIRERRTALKVNGDAVPNLSALAQHLPLTVIEPGSFDIIAGGPGRRRQYIDWVVFHVEHGYAGLWQRCQKVISQRNQLLRSGRIDQSVLRAWNHEYVRLAEEVAAYRERWFLKLAPIIDELLAELAAPWVQDLSADLFRGWDRQRELAEILEQSFEQERKSGHTLYGPNRCDIRLRLGAKAAAEVLSRGQQKTLVILLKLAQGELLFREKGRSCGFLLDDINAELDFFHQEILARQLQRLGSQVFVTSISRPEPHTLWPDALADLRMFHVEHGALHLET